VGWKNDLHGLVFSTKEAKLYHPSHTWGMKLNQLNRQKGTVRIVTYRLPGREGEGYYEQQIARRPSDMCVLIGIGGNGIKAQRERAQELKNTFPDVRVAVHSELHTKAVSIAPGTLYLGSANFGASDWADVTIGVRSSEAHDYFVEKIFEPLWAQANELC